jgi:phage-related protein
MSAYNRNDMKLLEEAYNLRLLKEQAPNMTINDVKNRLDLMSESELEYINTVNERILNEFWGGLKNVAQGVKSAGSSAVQGVKNVAGNAANAVKAAGQGALAAGKQVVNNAAEMYNSGNVAAQSNEAIKKAQTSTQQLIDLVTQAQQQGLIKTQGNVADMTLADIIDELTTAQQSAQTFKNDAVSNGFTGGIGNAAKQAYQNARQ